MYIALLIISNFARQIKIVMSALILLQFYKWYVDVTNSKRMKVNTKVLILNFFIISKKKLLKSKETQNFYFIIHMPKITFFQFSCFHPFIYMYTLFI